MDDSCGAKPESRSLNSSSSLAKFGLSAEAKAFDLPVREGSVTSGRFAKVRCLGPSPARFVGVDTEVVRLLRG